MQYLTCQYCGLQPHYCQCGSRYVTYKLNETGTPYATIRSNDYGYNTGIRNRLVVSEATCHTDRLYLTERLFFLQMGPRTFCIMATDADIAWMQAHEAIEKQVKSANWPLELWPALLAPLNPVR